MKKLIRFCATLFFLVLLYIPGQAQRYDDIYRSADAIIIQSPGDSTKFVVKGATVMLKNGYSQLNIFFRIPYNVVSNLPEQYIDSVNSGYLFRMNLNIDVNAIQQVLTSTKVFQSQGIVTLNNITRPVSVNYMPVVSGVNQQGDFNIYLRIQFYPSDFNLDDEDSNVQFIIVINNAPVNRI